MSVTDELLANRETYAARFDKGDLALPPAKEVAVVACRTPGTDCGMLTFTEDDFRRSIQEETGIKPEWAAEAFGDLDEDVRQSIARIEASPFIPQGQHPRLRLRGRERPPARSDLSRRSRSPARNRAGGRSLR